MRKTFKIIILSIVMALCVIGLVACGSDTPSEKDGLKIKKFNNDVTWTVYGYSGEDTVIDIAALAKDEAGNPVTVGRIMQGAFKDNDTITKIIVPDTVEKIDAGAFKNMGKLKELVLPFIGGTPIADGYYAESDKSEDKSIDAERTFAYIFGTEEYDGGVLFTQVYASGENKTEDHYIPATLEKVTVTPAAEYTIPMYAFACGTDNWTHIEEIVLGDNVTALGNYAFNNFVSLTTIDTNKVESIGEYAFEGCTNLKSGLTFGSVESIGDHAFSNVAIVELTLPGTLTSIGKYAFESSKITSLVLPASLETVSEGAFANCVYLKKVTVKNSAVEIAAFAFDGCTALNTFGPEGTSEGAAVFTGYTVSDMAFSRVDKDNFTSITGLSDVDKVFFSVE